MFIHSATSTAQSRRLCLHAAQCQRRNPDGYVYTQRNVNGAIATPVDYDAAAVEARGYIDGFSLVWGIGSAMESAAGNRRGGPSPRLAVLLLALGAWGSVRARTRVAADLGLALQKRRALRSGARSLPHGRRSVASHRHHLRRGGAVGWRRQEAPKNLSGWPAPSALFRAKRKSALPAIAPKASPGRSARMHFISPISGDSQCCFGSVNTLPCLPIFCFFMLPWVARRCSQ